MPKAALRWSGPSFRNGSSSATLSGDGGPSRQRIQALAQSLSALKVSDDPPKHLIELDDRLMRFEAAEQSKLKLLRDELERTRVRAALFWVALLPA